MDVAAAVVLGVAAGFVSGLLGGGGGILFVPALSLALGLGQHEAEATSLLAIVPVALVGAARQRRYGNLRLDVALLVGVLAIGGTVAGVALANALPEASLRACFAALMLVVAAQLARRGLTPEPPPDPPRSCSTSNGAP
jgi:uncharacterized membrane protein YfcA